MNFRSEQDIMLENYRQQISELQKENEELSCSLHDVNEKLRDSERLKGHFISNVTNEIVNPFTSILALAQDIKQLKDGEITKAHHMAGLIFEEAFHLDFQLKNIFAAALIEAGKEEITWSSVDLRELCGCAERYFRPFLEKKQIRLSFDFIDEEETESVNFITDREKLDLILKNLVSNSIKYSHEGSVIEILFRIGNGKLMLEISDHGKGIHPEARKVIFDRFKQLDEKINSVNTGHGLGLSIVEAYAEMLGGRVNIGDNHGDGVVVSVCIEQGLEVDECDDLEGFIFDSETSF